MAFINGKRTVYCRHCYQKGHNRRSCPTLSPEMKERYASGGDLARKCSYCGEAGHTRRKCEKRQTDMSAYVVKNAQYRKEFLEHLVALGVGAGSLVYTGETVEDLNSLAPSQLYMVQGIDWDNVQAHAKHAYLLHCVNVAPEGYANTFMVPPPDNMRSWYKLNVLTRADESVIRNAVPAGWFAGTSGIERFFK